MGIYLLDYLKSVIWAIEVFILTLLHRHSADLLQICSTKMHDRDMNLKFTRALAKQQDLLHLKQKVIDRMEIFSVSKALEEFQHSHRMTDSNRETKLIIENVKLCLHSILFVNTVLDRIFSLTHTIFDIHQDHHLALLDRLWSCLKPNERRGSWGEIGFQGQDPSTDFRGMGLLGLIQLVYFSSKGEGKTARGVLLEANHPRRYYPFAATGINFSAFVVEMARERRLHERIFRRLERVEIDFPVDVEGGPASDERLVEVGVNEVHEVYCEVFATFNDMWVVADPPNVLSFPPIFSSLKNNIRGKYVSAVE